MMTDEEIKDKLRKMLFLTQRANECGLSNNDFKEDIDTLSGALGLLDKKDKVIDLIITDYLNLSKERMSKEEFKKWYFDLVGIKKVEGKNEL